MLTQTTMFQYDDYQPRGQAKLWMSPPTTPSPTRGEVGRGDNQGLPDPPWLSSAVDTRPPQTTSLDRRLRGRKCRQKAGEGPARGDQPHTALRQLAAVRPPAGQGGRAQAWALVAVCRNISIKHTNCVCPRTVTKTR